MTTQCAHHTIVEHIWTGALAEGPSRTWSWIECRRCGTVLDGMKVTPMAETEEGSVYSRTAGAESTTSRSGEE